jgi:MoaA/NifB/PqqE/SkfB family radical SAM enzyme
MSALPVVDRRQIFAIPGRVELATERCDLRCDWCEFCRGRDIPAPALQRVWSAPPPSGTRVVRVRGGDTFRYGDLSDWVEWVRKEPGVAVCIEGPAATLAGEDRQAVQARLAAAAPDAIAVVLPTADSERTLALTGAQWDPALAVSAIGELIAAGIAAEVVFPVHPDTVGELPRVVGLVANRLGGAVDVTLRRAVPARDDGCATSDRSSDWPELDTLSEAIAALPPIIPSGARLQFDPAHGYAACMLRPPARRRDLLAGGGRRTGALPLGAICQSCAWSPHCTFRADSGVPPANRIHPLTIAEAGALDAPQRTEMGAEPRPFHTDRASVGLPNLLCLAPWTTLTATDPRRNSVPCALSWVHSDMTPEENAAELGTSVDDERALETTAGIERQVVDGSWYVVANERLSLMELWNSPLLRLMRREMRGGEKSSRCRSMCRVVMGVEERGIVYFQRAEDELTPAIVANRRRLLEEVHAGKEVLTAKPLDLVMGVAAHCNISCGFCDGPLGRYGDLSDRRRDEIIELLPTLMSFGVSGPGEPLMNKNFLALLRHISDTGYPSLVVSLTTNGTLLTPQLLARNANVPWGSVRISLNSGSADTYERMTGKRYFDRIMTNLDALCALRERGPRRFSITLSLVLGSVQMGDLAKFAQIVHERRTGIVVEPMYDNLRGLSPWVRADRLPALVDELGSVADSYVEKNPDIARAFRAVEGFARERMRAQDYEVLKGH